jgi:hypothetical protein
VSRGPSHYGIEQRHSRVDRAEWARDRRHALRVDGGQRIAFLVAAMARDRHPNEFRNGSGMIWPVGNIGSETPGTDANKLIDAAEKRRRAMQ